MQVKFIHLSAHLSSFYNQARPHSSLQHVYCILILLTFLVIFLDNLHLKYPIPIECAPCLLSFFSANVPLRHWFTLFPSNSLNSHICSIRAPINYSFTSGLSVCIFSYLSIFLSIYIVSLSSADVILKSSFFASHSLPNTSKYFDLVPN